MFTRGCFQLLDGIFTDPLVYIVNRDITTSKEREGITR
jgi:hypothetical protein